MNAYDTMVAVGRTLSQEVADEIFDTLPENGPVLSVMDRQGNCWSSDPGQLMALGLDSVLLEDLRAKIDDGVEPAVAQIGDTTVVGTQLTTDRTDCGHLVLAVTRNSAERTPLNLDMVEALFGQVELVATLIEDRRLRNETQAACVSIYGTAQAPAN